MLMSSILRIQITLDTVLMYRSWTKYSPWTSSLLRFFFFFFRESTNATSETWHAAVFVRVGVPGDKRWRYDCRVIKYSFLITICENHRTAKRLWSRVLSSELFCHSTYRTENGKEEGGGPIEICYISIARYIYTYFRRNSQLSHVSPSFTPSPPSSK